MRQILEQLTYQRARRCSFEKNYRRELRGRMTNLTRLSSSGRPIAAPLSEAQYMVFALHARVLDQRLRELAKHFLRSL